MATIAIILSGCGVFDGSEIHETTLTYYFLDKQKHNVYFYAPNQDQTETINHVNQNSQNEKRNMLNEAARITRGPIQSIDLINLSIIDAIIFPGGFGVAKNLSNYATQDTKFTIQTDIEKLIIKAHQNKIPMGFMCIAPVLAAKLIPNARLTLGFSNEAQEKIDALGGKGIQANFDDVVVDTENKLISTPAYMINESISNIAIGIEKLVQTIIDLCDSNIEQPC